MATVDKGGQELSEAALAEVEAVTIEKALAASNAAKAEEDEARELGQALADIEAAEAKAQTQAQAPAGGAEAKAAISVEPGIEALVTFMQLCDIEREVAVGYAYQLEEDGYDGVAALETIENASELVGYGMSQEHADRVLAMLRG